MFKIDLETLSYQDGILKRPVSDNTLKHYLQRTTSRSGFQEELIFRDVESGVISIASDRIKAIIPPMKVNVPYYDVGLDFDPDYQYYEDFETEEIEFITPPLLFTASMFETSRGTQLDLGSSSISWIHFLDRNKRTAESTAHLLPPPFPNLFSHCYDYNTHPLRASYEDGRICWGESEIPCQLMEPSKINQLISEFFYNYSNNDLDANFMLETLAYVATAYQVDEFNDLKFDEIEDWVENLTAELQHNANWEKYPGILNRYFNHISPQAFYAYRDLARLLKQDSLHDLLQYINRFNDNHLNGMNSSLQPIFFISYLQHQCPEDIHEFEWAEYMWDILGRMFD